MKTTLSVLLDLKVKYEKKYDEFEQLLLDDRTGQYEFKLLMQEMSGLRIAIRILENEIKKELE